MSLNRSIVVVLVSPLMVTAGTVGARAATAPQSPPGNLLVAGEVSRAKGALPSGASRINITQRQGVVRGAVVKLIWYPGLTEAAEGRAITPVVVTTAHSDGHGRFQLAATPSAQMLAEASRNGGWVN